MNKIIVGVVGIVLSRVRAECSRVKELNKLIDNTVLSRVRAECNIRLERLRRNIGSVLSRVRAECNSANA